MASAVAPAPDTLPRWVWPVVAVLLWLSFLRFPADNDTDLDASWRLCLAHFYKHDARAGVDYVWTYGPLGYFTTPAYDPDLFWQRCAWEVAFTATLAGLFAGLGTCLPSRYWQAAFVAVIFFLVEALPDTLYPAAIVLAVVLALRAHRAPRGVLVVVGAFLAVLALTKFTYMLLATAGWGLLVVGSWRGRGRFVEALLGFPVALLVGWCALGQHVTDFPTYVAASREIASGYAEAMSAEGTLHPRLGAVGLLALLAALALALRRTRLWRGQRLGGLALVLLAVAIEWRHGFIRQPSHEHLFFNHLRVAPFVIIALAGAGGRIPWTLAACILGLSWCLWWQDGELMWRPQRVAINASRVLDLAEFRRQCQKQRDALGASHALPKLAALAGNEPTDLISSDQMWLLLNDFNYRPRPVFQSYSAYTSRLLDENAGFFRSERAPRFVLVRLRPIDDHFPTSEDGPALLELMQRYRVVAEERDVLLLERQDRVVVSGGRQVVWEGEVGFGEEIRLDPASSGVRRILSAHIADTTRGRIEKSIGRPPPLFLRLRQDGGEATYRLVPAMAAAGFLLDPLVAKTGDLKRLERGETLPHVTAFSVEASPQARAFYQERLRIVVEEEATER
jgi:hypothetical protein